MLTGLYPTRHGILGTHSGDSIPRSIPTAPELLSAAGYRTICVSENGYAGEAKGLDDRFDEFIRSSSYKNFLSFEGAPTLIKYLLKTRSDGPGLTINRRKHKEQNSFFTTDITKRRLRRDRMDNKPFFCYVHYNDPHHPYIPPRSYRDEFISEINATAEEAMEFAQRMHNELYEWMADGVPLSRKEWEMLYAMYDAVIKYTDSCVGEIVDFVTKNFDDTIVVITSDHGELFGECGLLGHHMVLHDAVIHVPMVTHNFEVVERHIDNPTQHIDVMKTLLLIAGADTEQFQGYDLREHSRERAISQDLRGTVDDTETRDYERIRQYNSNVDLSHLPKSTVRAVRTTDFKLVQTDEWSRLYEFPNEDNDVSSEYPDVFRKLDSFLNEWMESEGEPLEREPESIELSEKTEQHLKEMGYVE
jgi:uncharacterized sulfatase